MCGRFVGSFSSERLMSELADAATDHGLEFGDLTKEIDYENRPTFNLAPTQAACVLTVFDGTLHGERMGWGLVPSWAKDATRAASMINARSETVTEKPSFRGLVKAHRCVVPMDGFYEWNRENPRQKVPHFCTRADGRLLLAAGLWTSSAAAPLGRTFCILTRESGSDLATVHDRCPVHLDSEGAVRWLVDADAPLELAQAANQPLLTVRRVGSRVNSVRNNDESLLAEVSGDDVDPGQPSLF